MRKLLVAIVLALVTAPGLALADGCYICTSDSNGGCDGAGYCRYSGSDTSENRNMCRKKGCKIGGTASCPTAANVKICEAPAAPQMPVPACFF